MEAPSYLQQRKLLGASTQSVVETMISTPSASNVELSVQDLALTTRLAYKAQCSATTSLGAPARGQRALVVTKLEVAAPKANREAWAGPLETNPTRATESTAKAELGCKAWWIPTMPLCA